MIKLYTFGPAFGLPDPSPFVIKATVLLRMAGLPFETDTSGFNKAPKGKLPYIDDDGTRVADSTFIRWHLESRHGADFDKGLGAAAKAEAWAFEKLCEDHIYWGLLHERWMVDSEFDRGPRRFFDRAPAPLRPLIVAKVRGDVRRAMRGHGFGRHGRDAIVRLTNHAVSAIADFLSDKPFLMGAEPCGADASVFGHLACVLCPHFDTPIRAHAERHANLVAYRDRGMARWFPDQSHAAPAQQPSRRGGETQRGSAQVAGVLSRRRRAAGGRMTSANERTQAMDATALIVMLVVGAIAGWLASIVVGGFKWGLIGYIVSGIIGGVVGPWLLSTLKVNLNLGNPMVTQIVTAAIGAIVVIFLARLIL
jgi:glutathione S-transferase/uncharacterized membrane protein YeaQ/YmgE (transglycosylase-associated protein family)